MTSRMGAEHPLAAISKRFPHINLARRHGPLMDIFRFARSRFGAPLALTMSRQKVPHGLIQQCDFHPQSKAFGVPFRFEVPGFRVPAVVNPLNTVFEITKGIAISRFADFSQAHLHIVEAQMAASGCVARCDAAATFAQRRASRARLQTVAHQNSHYIVARRENWFGKSQTGASLW